MDGFYDAFEMADPYPDVAYLESLTGRLYAEEADRVECFQPAYDQIWKTALGPKKSAELISAAMEESRDTPDGTDP